MRAYARRCGRGGTGRHTGLKILRGKPHPGSTPGVRTMPSLHNQSLRGGQGIGGLKRFLARALTKC
jgi:hypothetical protein